MSGPAFGSMFFYWHKAASRRRSAMSAFGTKQKSISTLNMSAFGGKAGYAGLAARCPL